MVNLKIASPLDLDLLAAVDTDAQRASSGRAPYREFTPPPHLRDLNVCFWRRGAGAGTAATRVLPDGCVDIIWIDGRPPFVIGPMTVAVEPAVNGTDAVVGIRFRPGVAASVLGVNASDLLDRDVPLRDLWPQRNYARWERIEPGAPVANTLTAITEAVTVRVQAMTAPDPFIALATEWIAKHPSGQLTQLGGLSGLSERQVRRRFDQAVGYGPKLLQRILRLQYLLLVASDKQTTCLGLARLALAAGYADQPHMTREVAAFSGASPRQLLVERGHGSAVSDLFKTP